MIPILIIAYEEIVRSFTPIHDWELQSPVRYHIAGIIGKKELRILKRELRSDALSYSYLTLQEMHKELPEDELYFIMGGDSLRDFKNWYHPELICSCTTLVAAIRDDCDRKHLMTYAKELKQMFSAEVRLIRTPNLSVASSELRSRAAAGETIRYQVPEAVRIYIEQHHLYRRWDPQEETLCRRDNVL